MENITKVVLQSNHCSKCNKTMKETNFYTYKDGKKCELCKSCLTMHINNWEPDTFLWLLEKFDVPYIETEWNVLRDRAYQKDPLKMNGMSVFGRYLSKMKLKQWKDYTWADTERLKEEAKKKAEECGSTEEQQQQKLEEMRKAYENGEISEAQWKTYQHIEAPAPRMDIAEDTRPALGGGYAFPQENVELIDLPDVGAELTAEDKIYLAIKWGRLYRPDQWVALEKLYTEFMDTFDIQGAARIDTLKMICKTSLTMNQAINQEIGRL